MTNESLEYLVDVFFVLFDCFAVDAYVIHKRNASTKS